MILTEKKSAEKPWDMNDVTLLDLRSFSLTIFSDRLRFRASEHYIV